MAFFIPRRLRDLFDVTAPSPSDGQVLSYESASSSWKPTPSAASAPAADVFAGFGRPLGFPNLPTSLSVLVANRVYLVRCVIPKTGTLAGIAYWVGAASGNYQAGVYDTGESLAGSRSLLFGSGTVAVPTGGAWRELATPSLSVTLGQHVDIALQADNATASFGRQVFGNSPGGSVLPATYAVAGGGALTKLLATGGTPGALGLPGTILEAAVADPSTNAVPVPLLRIT